MTTAWISAVLIVLTVMIFQPATAQDLTSQIVGTWKITSQVRKEIESGATANIFGTKPTGHIVYTKSGHTLFFIASNDRQRPGANPTDAERIALFRSLAGASGTYKVQGSKIISRYESSWHELWTGAEIATDAAISGKMLTLTTAPFKSPQDGKDVVVVTTWERVE
jgi:Lipocalin-like domain